MPYRAYWFQSHLPPCSISLDNHHCHRDRFAVSQAQRDPAYPHLYNSHCCPPAPMQRRAFPSISPNLNLFPTDSAADSCPKRLGTRFLGRKPCRKALACRLPLPLAVRNLSRRKHPFQKSLPKARNALLHPPDLNQIRPDPNHHGQPPPLASHSRSSPPTHVSRSCLTSRDSRAPRP